MEKKKYNYNKKENGSNDTGTKAIKYNNNRPNELLEYFKSFELLKKEVVSYKDEEGGKNVKVKNVGGELPTVYDYCLKIDICEDTFYEWVKKEKKFAEAYNKCKQIMKKFLVKNTLTGKYNNHFATFLMINWFRDEFKRDQAIDNKIDTDITYNLKIVKKK